MPRSLPDARRRHTSPQGDDRSILRLGFNPNRVPGAANEFKGLGSCCAGRTSETSPAQQGVIRYSPQRNRQTFQAWQLGEESRQIFAVPLLAARRAVDGFTFEAASLREAGSRDPHLSAAIEATIEWRLTDGMAESQKASTGRIRTDACGFHNPKRSSQSSCSTAPASRPPYHGSTPYDPRLRQLSLKPEEPVSPPEAADHRTLKDPRPGRGGGADRSSATDPRSRNCTRSRDLHPPAPW